MLLNILTIFIFNIYLNGKPCSYNNKRLFFINYILLVIIHFIYNIML